MNCDLQGYQISIPVISSCRNLKNEVYSNKPYTLDELMQNICETNYIHQSQ
jgi:hypothetical protein